MAQEEVIVFNRDKIIRCDYCGNHARLPLHIFRSQLPCTVSCPECQTVKHIETGTKLPKVAPLPDLHNWTISFPKNKEEEEHKPSEIKEVDLDSPPKSFYSMAEQLGELTVQMFQCLGNLGKELHAFEHQIAKHFKQCHSDSVSFSKCWQPKHLEEFLKFPYVVIPIPCEDKLAEQYAFWVISPKFFECLLGVPVESSGGFKVRLLTQYLRMVFPVENSTAIQLGMPETLELEVKSSKILGASLPFCWKDIPGLTEDYDSTEQWTSVIMKDPYRARQWLAQHGVPGWESRSLRPEELNVRKIEEHVFDRPTLEQAWLKYHQHGRLGIFWEDELEARRAAILIALMTKGITPVFVEGTKQQMAWQGLYLEFNPIRENSTPRKNQEMIFFRNGVATNWKSLHTCKLIIVDLYGDLDLEILQELYRYQGHLVLIGRDWLLDSFGENSNASLIHGLCGYEIFDTPSLEIWKKGTQLQTCMPELAQALRNLQKVNRF